MHTKDKWEIEDISEGFIRKFRIICKDTDESNVEIVAEVYNEANAKRICLTHNSHEGLVEACKAVIKSLQKDRLTMYVNFQIRKQMKKAIAQAEE